MKILTISEMIEQLEAIKEKEGDIGVVVEEPTARVNAYMTIDDMYVNTIETKRIAYNNSSIYAPVPPDELRCVVLF